MVDKPCRDVYIVCRVCVFVCFLNIDVDLRKLRGI